LSERAGALRASGRLFRIAGLAAVTLARTGARSLRPGAPDRRRAAAALIARASRTALAIHHLEVESSGPRPVGPALLVSNHLSYLDPLVVATCVDCLPISKSDLASWPIFGTVARRTGVLFVERSSPSSRIAVMRESERALRDGALLLNFPEGTTTDGSTVLRFRKGLFGVARELKVPVVPLALSYEPRELAWIGDDTFLPHYLRFSAIESSRARIAFGEPINSRAHATPEDLAGVAHARTLALLEERPAWLRKAR